MTSSYEKIDYRIRPAKAIERKMFVEAFRRLCEFGSVENYRYVGFGAVYFTDFILFHKQLGFKEMISIEKSVSDKDRVNFNCPFKCIEIKFGKSNHWLPRLQWNTRSIVWLDYDGVLTDDELEDIRCLCMNVVGGSVVIVSVNAEPHKPYDQRLSTLRNQIDERKIPNDVTDEQLAKWGTAKIYQQIIKNEIEEVLTDRNSGMRSGRVHFEQLFHFHYSDGAKMLTTGGIFIDDGQRNLFAKCSFESLDFIRRNSDPFLIETPKLTVREIRHLETLLPSDENLCAGLIPEKDVNEFRKVYRYFPVFVEAEM